MMRYIPLLVITLTHSASVLASDAASGNAFRTVVAGEDVDYEATQTFHDGESKLISRRVMTMLLDKQQGSWSAGGIGNKWVEDRTYGYRLAFHRPTRIGSMSVRFGGWKPDDRVKFYSLKADAPYPGDVSNTDHWQPLWSRFEHGRIQVIAPPGTDTRAVYCEQIRNYGNSVIVGWEIHDSRLINVTPLGIAQAEWKTGGTRPIELTRGNTWYNVGTFSEDGLPWRGPVSEVDPSWIILNLDTNHMPCAVRLRGTVGKLKLYQFVGDERVNPALAEKDQWRRVSLQDEQFLRQFQQAPLHLLSFTPRKTRALKLILASSIPVNKEQVRVQELSVLTDLGEADVPEFPVEKPNPAPSGFEYQLEEDSEVAIVLENGDGSRVRNLVAQVSRTAGGNLERWDLKDERGHMVSPGRYRWRGIHAPPLGLINRHTPYPNVEMYAPDNLPWNRRTQDGWLANHTNHTAVCAAGDRLYVGTGGSEGGHASLEANLDGQKLRGFGFAAHQHGMFTDGTDMFVWTGGGIYKLDKEKGQLRQLFSIPRTVDRKGTVRGLAAHEDRIYLNYYDQIDYFDLATHFDNVDLNANYPQLREAVKTKEFYGIVTTPRKDFASLFRLGEFVPGIIAPEGITHIPSTFGSHPTQFSVLVFKQPVPLGSLLFPNLDDTKLGLSISILKPGMPALPGQGDSWQTIWDSNVGLATGKAKLVTTGDYNAFRPWQCIPAPAGTMTKAIRLTFIDTERDVGLVLGDRTVDDGRAPSLDDADSNDLFGGEKKARSILEGGNSWRTKFAGMRLLRRRFQSVEPDQVHVNSGQVNKQTAVWDAQRTTVVTPDDPGIYVMQWDKAQTLRGLGIKEIGGATTHIDVYTGDSADIDITAEKGWRRVSTYKQRPRSGAHMTKRNNARAVYLDKCVDFGSEVTTRAIRLRIVKPQIGTVMPDKVLAAAQARRCKVFGITALRYLGGERPVEGQIMVQRLETRSATTGELLHEVLAEIDGDMAVNPQGEMYGTSKGEIVKIDPQTGRTSDSGVPDHRIPGILQFDTDGNLYAFDYDRARCNIRVYEPQSDGGFVYSHDVGAPGIAGPGLRNPAQLDDATSFSIDKNGSLWAVYPHVWPRRVSHFKTDGTFVKEMLGNTMYGGGGTMDRYDKSRVYYKDMEFEVDVDGGSSRIKAFNTRDHNYTNPWFTYKFRDDLTAVMIDGRRYLVTTPLSIMHLRPAGWVHLVNEETRAMKLVAGVGMATASDFFRTPQFMDYLNGKPLSQLKFVWADRNGDERPQPEEVTFSPVSGGFNVGRFSLDLSLPTSQGYYRVKEFLPDGVPLYEEVQLGKGRGGAVRFSDGSFLQMGFEATTGGGGWNRVIDKNGKELWRYPAWCGVSGLWIAPWSPGYAPNQLVVAGHEIAPEGDLGEFVVISANTGQLNIWTKDGLLAGQVCYHTRNPERTFFPGTNKNGTRMDRYSQGQEHFHAFFTRTEDDDRYFIVTGGNHISIVEVTGLEKFKRFKGEVVVTPEMIHRTRSWDEEREKKRNFVVAQAAECYQVRKRPRIDGSIGEKEWPPAVTSIHQEVNATLNMGYDGAYLYLGYKVTKAGPLKNNGDDFRRLFKTGGGVDIKIGTSPYSDPDRVEPEVGDIRMLLTYRDDQPAVVIYRPIAPDADPDSAWSTSTPAGGTTSFDEVSMLSGVRMARSGGDNSYTLEAAVPLRLLGIRPEPGMMLKMDWGVISTDHGARNVGRNYWADRTAVGSTDEPTEARFMPALWGHVRFRGSNDDSLPQLTDADPGGLLRNRKPDAALADFLEELKGQ
jgi:hypothetical protein